MSDTDYREFLIHVLSRTSHGDGTWVNRGVCAADCLKCEAQRRLDALSGIRRPEMVPKGKP